MFNTLSARFRLMGQLKLGDRVRLARLDKGWSQRELARRIGKSATYVHYLEGGANPSAKGKEMQIPSDVVDELARVLQLDKDELRLSAGLAPENLEREPPKTVQELLDRLTELGIEAPLFQGGIENLPDDPDVLENVLRVISTTVEIELRKSHNAPQTHRRSLLHE
jgi:transcriptional regulator with XRE-family HTH domain